MLNRVRQWVRAAFLRRRLDREMQEEMQPPSNLAAQRESTPGSALVGIVPQCPSVPAVENWDCG